MHLTGIKKAKCGLRDRNGGQAYKMILQTKIMNSTIMQDTHYIKKEKCKYIQNEQKCDKNRMENTDNRFTAIHYTYIHPTSTTHIKNVQRN